MASNALTAARAAGVNPDVVYVPRPSATPAQQAEVEETGTVAPLYTANPAPMGLAYYGLSGTGTGTPTATTLTTTAINGSVDVNALWGEDLYQAKPDSFSIQMNAVLTGVTLFGNTGYTFWTQDIATYIPSTQNLMLVTNIWNFSGVQLSPNYLYATSGTFYADDFYDYSTLGFYYSNYTLQGVTEPFDLTLTMTSGLGSNNVDDAYYEANSVTFGASVSYDDGVTHSFPDLDQVTFSSVSSSAPESVGAAALYTASGTQLNPLGLTDDFELVICGPGGGSNVDIGDANVDLSLSSWNGDYDAWVEIPAAYSYGGDTGETASGVSVDYFGNSPSSYYGWMTGGPSILTGLWGTGAPGGDGYLDLAESPSNAFNFFIYNGAAGFSTPISFEQAFAPNLGVVNQTLYLMPGDYSIVSELSDYTMETTHVVVTLGEYTLDTISLTPERDMGIYTPLWAFSNAEVAEFAMSGSGVPSSPYLLNNYQPGSFSPNFGLYNDYAYPVFPGVFFDGIDSSVELYEPPNFNASTNDSQSWGDDLPQTNELQYWFWDVSNFALVNATNISGWFGAMGYSPLYFNSFNVVFYDSSDNFVASNSFFTESQALLMYTGLSGPDYNTVWGNQFVQIAPPRQCPASSSCLGLVPYDFGLGLEIGEDFDLIYNNLFATPTTAWLLPLNLVTGSPQLYPDNLWNIGLQAASYIYYLVGGATLSPTANLKEGFPTIPLTGSIVGGMTQGGNSWWDQGVVLNWDNGAVNTDSSVYDENAPTLLDPLSGYPTYWAALSPTEYPCNSSVSYSAYITHQVGYYCATYIYGATGGDSSPLATITESVSFEAEGSGGSPWAASICGTSAKPPGGPPPSCGTSAKPPGGVPPGEGSIESLWLYTSFTTSATDVNMLLPPGAYSWSIPVSPVGKASETQTGTLSVSGTPALPTPPSPVTPSFVTGYTETVTESGLPTGSVWWFNVTGRLPLSGTVTPSTTTINDVLPNGPYSYAISGPPGSIVVPATAATGAFDVSGTTPPGIQVTFMAVSPSATPNPVDVSQTTTISAGASGGSGTYASYVWSGPVLTGCPLPTGTTTSSFICTPGTAGSYSITAGVTDSDGNTVSNSFTLTVNAGLVVSPSATPNPVDVSQTTTISAGASGGSETYTSFVWSGTVPTGCALPTSTTTPWFVCTPGTGTAGPYSITAAVTDSNGITVSNSFMLTVNAGLVVSPSATQNPVDVDQMTTISAGASGGSGTYTSYAWSGTVPTGCALPTGTTTSSFPCTPGTGTAGPYSITAAVTDSNGNTVSKSFTLTVNAALTAPGTPTVSATKLDVNQALTVTGTIPTTGTSPYAWQWLVSVNGGGYVAASQCTLNSGTGAAAGATVTCVIPGGTLTVGDTYSFELKVTDSATVAETQTSAASSTVKVASALTAPVAPLVSATKLDVNEVLIAGTGTIPGTGTSPYSWAWMVSVSGGLYVAATQCTLNSGTGGSAGLIVICVIPGGTLTPGDTYNFELEVTDSASMAETQTSAASPTVKVASALTAPGAPAPSATKLDVNQGLTVTGTIPTTGTSPYAWQWLVSVNGGGYVVATQCTVNSGTGALAKATETCSITGGKLSAGYTYAFELRVTDSATVAETQTSAASLTVKVASVLTAPGAPSVSTTTLVVSQALTVTGTIPTTGTSPYAWQWLVSVNGGGYVAASQCTLNSGTGAAAGATVTCVIPGGTLTVGDTYSFELKVTDSATVAETQTSAASRTVKVVS